MAKTTKSAFDGSYVTHGDDGTTYRTTKNVLDNDYTTHGSDGSSYRTTRNILDKGYTTYQTQKPYKKTGTAGGMGGDIGASATSLAIAVFAIVCCGYVLSPSTYVYIALVVASPLLSGVCERFNISRLWSLGVLFCWSSFCLIDAVWQDSMAAASSDGGATAITLCALALLLLAVFTRAIFCFDGRGVEVASFFVLFVSLPAAFLGALGGERTVTYMAQLSNTISNPFLGNLLLHWRECAIGLLLIFAIIHQISLVKTRIERG